MFGGARLWVIVAVVLSVATASVDAAVRAPSRLPLEVLTQPNRSPHDPLSLDSGLRDIAPCDGASVALQPIWLAAGDTFHLDWHILAGITQVESGFGCNMGPSSAGAVGWTQFLPATWERWGMDADGDGKADPYNAVDAVFSTARYLRVTGAPADYHRAILAYNHAEWYYHQVMDAATTFGAFTDSQFTQLARWSQQALQLRQRMTVLSEGLDRARAEVGQLRARAHDANTRLRASQRALAATQRSFAVSRGRLDQATRQYVQITQSISAGVARPTDPEQQVLAYVADASIQDAAVVYQSASSLLDLQARRLARLRAAATAVARTQDALTALVSTRQALARERMSALGHIRTLIAARRQELIQARRDARHYRQLARRYAALYQQQTGQAGSVDGSPWQVVQSQLALPGVLRWPLNGPVISGFGQRCLAEEGRRCRPHQGLDIAADSGTPVHVAGDGIVTRRQTADESGGYGNFLCVTHEGAISSCYAHLSTMTVHAGQRVHTHQVIGEVGCTGHCYGPHLHFEIRLNDVPQDPLLYMPKG